MNLTREHIKKIAVEAMRLVNEASAEVENGHLHRDGIAAVLVADALQGDTDVRDVLLGKDVEELPRTRQDD